MQPVRVTMTRVIEPIGIMALSFHRAFATNSSSRINPSITILQLIKTFRPTVSPIASAFSSSNIITGPDLISKTKPVQGDKANKATTIKKLYKENKKMFGELLETKSVKAKRVKKEAKITKKMKKEIEATLLKNIEHTNKSLDTGDETKLVNPLDSYKSSSDTNSVVKLSQSHSTSELIASESLTDNYLSDVRNASSDRSSKNVHKEAEINWNLNIFPQRMKIISRTNPNKTLHSFDEDLPLGKIQLVKKDQVSTQGGAEGQSSNAVPSVKQFISSIYDVNTMPTVLVKLIRRDGTHTTLNIPEAELESNASDIDLQSDSIYYDTTTVADVEKLDDVIVEIKSEYEKSHSNPIIEFPHTNPQTAPQDFSDQIMAQNSLRSKVQITSLAFPKWNSSEQSNCETRYPSISKILNATMPKEQVEALDRWQQKMIANMGEEGFLKYKEDLLNNGKMLHTNIQHFLSGTPVDQLSIAEPISGHWNSLRSVLPEIQQVHVLESHVVHPQLHYCGIVDCVAVFGNKLVVIDWKTSQKPKPFVSMTYATPIQIAAYIGAINYDPNYSLKIDEGLIVIAYEDGRNCQTFSLNPFEVSKYWKQWLNRLSLFQQTQPQSSSSPSSS